MTVEIDNSEVLTGGEGKSFPVAKAGSYLARITDVVKYHNERFDTDKLRFHFQLVRNAFSGKPVVDMEDVEHEPCAVTTIKTNCNVNSIYKRDGKIGVTNTGEVLRAVGIDPEAAKPDLNGVIGKLLVVTVSNYEKSDGSKGAGVDSVAAYENDDYEDVLSSLPALAEAPAK